MKKLLLYIIFGAVVGAGLILYNNQKSFFKMTAGSMEPTILKNELVNIDWLAYVKGEPKRGEIIVFKIPEGKKYIKRIVGLPNEIVEIKDGIILINGLPNAIANSHKIYYYNSGDYGKEGVPLKIPEYSYYVLGDNSKESRDSRNFGFIPRQKILGKVISVKSGTGKIKEIE